MLEPGLASAYLETVYCLIVVALSPARDDVLDTDDIVP